MQRRHFLGGALWASMPSERVNVAIMGVRGRGRALTREFAAVPGVNIAWLCDVDENVFTGAAQHAEEKGFQPQRTGDLRRVLDDKQVDALVIATPDHWHAPATLLACQAGKDVYVEKPASHNLREGRLMVEAARKHKRVVQVGTQARSRPSTRRAIEFAHSGKIGRVLAAKAWNTQLRENIGHKPDRPVPPGVDYEAWTGPAPLLPFNENRFHYKWHWHWNYGTGDMGNDGVHQLDQARWALNTGLPHQVTGMGRKLFFDDDQQTPDTMNIAFDYPGKVLIFEMRNWNPYGMNGIHNGVAVYGSEGMVEIGTGFKVFDAKGQVVHAEKGTPDEHAANFIECVRSRAKPNADIESGHLSAALCHLGNIAARTGRALKFDPASETITGDEEAARMLAREYRRHWSTPR